MALPVGDIGVDLKHEEEAAFAPAGEQHVQEWSGEGKGEEKEVDDTLGLEVGQRDFPQEGALCHLAEKSGLTLKGQINIGGKMEITHHNMQDNRTINKQVHHHHGDVHQSQHVHYNTNETGYAQIQHQTELAMLSDEEVFVETWAFRAAVQQLSDHGVLVLSGPSGCGKTCVAHALLRRYKASDYTPLVLHKFEEWRTHVGGDRQQVILLEDIFGKDQLQTASFKEWLHVFPIIQRLATNEKCLVIFTVNDVVLDTLHAEHGSSGLLSHALNLTSSEACLSDEEKKSILERHLKQTEKSVPDERLEEIIQSAKNIAFFPLRCKMFAESPLDEGKAAKVFVAESAFGTCGTGPKVFIKIAPNLIQKSLLKPTPKAGRWGYSFQNTKSDIGKPFDDDWWTTKNIQHTMNLTGTDTDKGGLSEHTKPAPCPVDKSKEQLTAGADTTETISRFETACRKGDNQLMLEIIEAEAGVLVSNKTDFTALHVAVLHGQATAVEALLEHEHPVNAVDSQSWSPLHVACYSGHVDIAELLIKYGADLELATSHGMRPSHVACRYGHANTLQLLLQNGDATEARSHTGYMVYPLHVAAYYGHVKVVNLLISFKAQTNVTDRTGWLPLHYACQEGHLKVVEILLSASTAKSAHASQLSITCQNGHIHLIRTLLQCGVSTHDPDGKTAVCRSCHLSNKLALENLFYHQACPDQPGTGNVTSLYLAAQNGHYEVANALLKAGACSEVRMSQGWTPLLVASYKGHHHLVDLLLRYRADVNDSLDNVLWTTVHLACANGHSEAVECLLQHGADPDKRDTYGFSPLHRACIHGQSNILPILLPRVKDFYTTEESAGRLLSLASEDGSVAVISSLQEWFPSVFKLARESPALHWACRNGHLEIVKIFLEHEFPVNAQSNDSPFTGETPLHVASLNGRPLIVETLLGCGAKVNEKTSRGETALHLACKENHTDVVRVLLQQGSADTDMRNKGGETPLHIAARRGLDGTVLFLLACGANVNAQDLNGESPLFRGSRHKRVAEILLEYEADTNMKTTKGETVLHTVCTYGRVDSLCSLLLYGVNLETKDSKGETALLRACKAESERINMVTLLIENEADVEAADGAGVTPVQVACQLGDLELLQLLLQNGGRVNSRNSSGHTPLQQACMLGHSHLIEVLLQAGARPNEPDDDGNTPLHSACASLQTDVVKVLLEHEANVSAKNKDGLSPMNIIQTVKLSDNFLQNSKKTEIMFAFMEINQRFPERAPSIVSQGTNDERCEISRKSDPAHSDRLQERHLDEMAEVETGRNAKKTGCSEAEKKLSDLGNSVTEPDDAKCAPTANQRDQSSRDDAGDVTGALIRETDTNERAADEMRVKKIAASRNDPLSVGEHTAPRNVSYTKNLTTAEPAETQPEKPRDRDQNAGIVQNINVPGDQPSVSPPPSSPFLRACYQGNLDLVLHHLLTSENIGIVSESGQNALHYACAAGQYDIVVLLLLHGADPTLKDLSGRTCLHSASLHGHLCTVDLLLAKGLDVNVVDNRGRSALHAASFQGHGLVAALLVNRGADINLPDADGNSALLLACRAGHLDACVVLLNFGADLDCRNKEGKGVHDVVRFSKNHLLWKLIVSHSSRSQNK